MWQRGAILVLLTTCLCHIAEGATLGHRAKRQANTGSCPAGETFITTRFKYVLPGDSDYKECGVLVGQVPDTYANFLTSQCQRWQGTATEADHVASAYVIDCLKANNDTIIYRYNVCCKGTQSDRCITCNSQDNPYICDNDNSITTCPAGQTCSTTYECDGTSQTPRLTKSCVSSGTCNSGLCTGAASSSTPSSCTDCCTDNFCNLGKRLQVCTYNPQACNCNGNGYCAADGTCICRTGCSGDQCQTCHSTCSPNPCQNGGYCSLTTTAHTCCCAFGYEGLDCQIAVSTGCSNDPCQNGGTCYAYIDGPRCDCPTGYVGETCQIDQTITCFDTSSYFDLGSTQTYPDVLTADCDAKAAQTLSLTQDTSTCLYLMKTRFGLQSVFANGQDGQVDEVEDIGYSHCKHSDSCLHYSSHICCPSCYSKPCQNGGYCTQLANGDYNCKCRFGFTGRNCQEVIKTCFVFGEPHIRTFDNLVLTFQGPCKYNLASPQATTVTPYFNVFLKTENRDGDLTVSYPSYVEVTMNGYTARLGKDRIVTVKYGNGAFQEVTPIATYQDFIITYSGRFLRLQTSFNVIVMYDGANVVVIQVPDNYKNLMGGLCNDNDDIGGLDDLFGCDGVQYLDTAAGQHSYGDSCLVPDPEIPNAVCSIPAPPECDPVDQALYSSDNWCGYVQSTTGPFRQCVSSSQVYHMDYFDSCVYDVCVNDSNKCPSLEAFVEACASRGLIPDGDWRTAVSCPLECPDNSVYEVSASACQPSCDDPDAHLRCQEPDREGCVCASPYIRQGEECVLTCACKYNNVQYQNSEVWGLQEQADGSCTQMRCDAVGQVVQDNNVSPVNGGWSAYSAWTACGQGDTSQSRTRTCDNPAPYCGGQVCAGPATDTQFCPTTNTPSTTSSTSTTTPPPVINPTPPSCSPNFRAENECHKCDRTRNPLLYVVDPCSCGFYQCMPMFGMYYVVHQACPTCTCWSNDTLTCERSTFAGCPPPQPQQRCTINNTPLGVVSGDNTKFKHYLPGGSYIIQDCAPGTVFDATEQCGCVHGINNRREKPFMCLDFDNALKPWYALGLWVDPKNVEIAIGEGRVGNAARFNGSANIEIPGMANKENKELSISFFYKREVGATGLQAMVSNDDCNTGAPATIQIRSDARSSVSGLLRTQQSNNAFANFQQVTANFNTWHHVVMTYDSQNVRLYVDNTKTETLPARGFTKRTHCPMRIGSMYNRAFFTGLIDQFCIYNYALTDADVTSLHDNPGDLLL